MARRSVFSKVVLYEVAGFAAIIALLWLDEIADIPHRVFGAPATPVNVLESVIETVLALLVASLVIGLTTVLMERIRYLQVSLPVCSRCHKVRVHGRWVPVEGIVAATGLPRAETLICAECQAATWQDDDPVSGAPAPG